MSAEMETVRRGQFWGTLTKKARQHRIPLMAMIELTYGCNLACVHCYNPTHQARGELATKEVYRILDQLTEAGCLWIGFTGGELLTRLDVFEIFDYAKAKGFTISILTNATLVTPERADRIQALKPRRVEISIYGATAETYERVTRVPGSFWKFLLGVELLRSRGIPLLVKMPVMTLNAHEVVQAKALVDSWGIKFVFCTEIFPRGDGSLEPLQYRLSPGEALRVERELVGARKWKAEGGGEKEQGCQAQKGLFTCKCGKTALAVTPYGEMNLCVAFAIPKFDLKSEEVSSGWKTLVDLVDSASATPSEAYECPTCELQRYCRQGPVNAWLETGDFSPCLPHFKQLAGLEKQAAATTASRSDSASRDTNDVQPLAPELTQDGLSPEAIRRVLIELLRDGYPLRSWARTESMSPLIRKGDLLTVKPITFADAQIGDIVAYRRDESDSVLTTHRVIQKGKDHGRPYLITKGDRSLYRDLPTVSPEQILGKIVSIEKPDRVIMLETPRQRLLAYLMARRSLGAWILRVVWGKILAFNRRLTN